MQKSCTENFLLLLICLHALRTVCHHYKLLILFYSKSCLTTFLLLWVLHLSLWSYETHWVFVLLFTLVLQAFFFFFLEKSRHLPMIVLLPSDQKSPGQQTVHLPELQLITGVSLIVFWWIVPILGSYFNKIHLVKTL